MRHSSLKTSMLIAALASSGYVVDEGAKSAPVNHKPVPNRKFTDKRKAEALRKKLNKRR